MKKKKVFIRLTHTNKITVQFQPSRSKEPLAPLFALVAGTLQILKDPEAVFAST